MSAHMVFTVEITELASGWRVDVDAGQEGSCTVNAPTARTALACAVPFMHGVVEPDPVRLPDLLRDWPTTVDGPRDQG
jgi:hypothetical protein